MRMLASNSSFDLNNSSFFQKRASKIYNNSTAASPQNKDMQETKKTRIELHLNQTNLELKLKPTEQKVLLRDKLEAKYLKEFELRTNRTTKYPSPSPSYKRLQDYGQVQGFMSPQNLGATHGFSTIPDGGSLYTNVPMQQFIQTGDNFKFNNNYKQHQNRGAKPRKTFMKNPKEIREKYE